MEERLIFDVGAHKGEDTAFYLAKGFRVVAIEANPAFCEIIKQRFKDAIADASLILLNVAIARETGSLDFFIDEGVSVWGTTKVDWVERNRALGAGKVSKINVNCLPLSEVVERYGSPRYCKIDIEGADVEALESLKHCETPQFISIESTKTNWNDLVCEFKILRSLGYRKFKVIDQSFISLQDCPQPSLEGKYVDFHFPDGSSGLFGNELPGSWLTAPEAIEIYKSIFRGYALNGDAGLFSRGGRSNLFNAIGALQGRLLRLRGSSHYINPTKALPPAGWYDTHASK